MLVDKLVDRRLPRCTVCIIDSLWDTMKLDLPTVIFALLSAKGRASQVPLTAESPDDVDELERKWRYNVNLLFPPYLPLLCGLYQ